MVFGFTSLLYVLGIWIMRLIQIQHEERLNVITGMMCVVWPLVLVSDFLQILVRMLLEKINARSGLD